MITLKKLNKKRSYNHSFEIKIKSKEILKEIK